jgi:hypothetical protein
MKVIIKGIFWVGVLLLACAASAQINLSGLNTSDLLLVPRDEVPRGGTFWIEGPNGMTVPPLPCPPADAPDAPIYALPNGQFTWGEIDICTFDYTNDRSYNQR